MVPCYSLQNLQHILRMPGDVCRHSPKLPCPFTALTHSDRNFLLVCCCWSSWTLTSKISVLPSSAER